MNIGTRIKDLRSERGFKAMFVADKIGVTSSVYSAIEHEKINITVDKLASLSDFFGVSTDYLIKGKDDRKIKTIDAIRLLQPVSMETLAKKMETRCDSSFRLAILKLKKERLITWDEDESLTNETLISIDDYNDW